MKKLENQTLHEGLNSHTKRDSLITANDHASIIRRPYIQQLVQISGVVCKNRLRRIMRTDLKQGHLVPEVPIKRISWRNLRRKRLHPRAENIRHFFTFPAYRHCRILHALKFDVNICVIPPRRRTRRRNERNTLA